MSGRSDLYINFYNNWGLQTRGKKLMHISCVGKLNWGWYKMYVGDFAEIVAYLSTKNRHEYIVLKELLSLRDTQKYYYRRAVAAIGMDIGMMTAVPQQMYLK